MCVGVCMCVWVCVTVYEYLLVHMRRGNTVRGRGGN